MDCKDGAQIFKVLGDETRLKIFEMLKSGTLCACKILEEFDITQPTLSYHMKLLCNCSLVISKKDGKWNYYSIDKDTLKFVKCCFELNEKCCENCFKCR